MRYLGAQVAPKDLATQDQLVDATPTQRGLMPAADKAKLNGVQSGATVNSPDATLLNRANHTGTQPLATISDAGIAARFDVTTSNLDRTPNRLMRVGDAGLMVTPVVSADTAFLPTGMYRDAVGSLTGSSAIQAMYLNVNYSVDGTTVDRKFQIGAPISSVEDYYVRTCLTNGAFTPVRTLWHNGNLVKQSGFTDLTPGSAMLWGAFGLGTLVAPAPSSIDSVGYTGFFLATSGNGNPNGGTGSTGLNFQEGSNFGWQLLGPDASTVLPLRWRNRSGNNVWGPWRTVWDSQNFNPADYSTTAQMQAAIVAATTGSGLSAAGSSQTILTSWFSSGALYLRFTGASALTLTVPANSAQAIPVGAELTVRRAGNANLTIVPASGVVINPPAGGTLVMTQNMTATLKKVAANEWDLIGQTVAA